MKITVITGYKVTLRCFAMIKILFLWYISRPQSSYNFVLEPCGTTFLRVLIHDPQKKVPAENIYRENLYAKFTPLAKLYIQISQVESCCCHLFKTSLSFVKQNHEMRNKTFRNKDKRFTGKNRLKVLH